MLHPSKTYYWLIYAPRLNFTVFCWVWEFWFQYGRNSNGDEEHRCPAPFAPSSSSSSSSSSWVLAGRVCDGEGEGGGGRWGGLGQASYCRRCLLLAATLSHCWCSKPLNTCSKNLNLDFRQKSKHHTVARKKVQFWFLSLKLSKSTHSLCLAHKYHILYCHTVTLHTM